MSVNSEIVNKYSEPLPCRTCRYALEPVGGFSRCESAFCKKYDDADNMKPYGVLFANKECDFYKPEEPEDPEEAFEEDAEDETAEEYLERLYGIRYDDDEGRWVTTEDNHRIHLNSEGKPDKGNPHVIAAMNGKNGGSSKTENAASANRKQVEAVKKARETANSILQQYRKEHEAHRNRQIRIGEINEKINDLTKLQEKCQKKIDALKGQEDSDSYKALLELINGNEEKLTVLDEEREKIYEENAKYDVMTYFDEYEKAAEERNTAVLAAFKSAKDCQTREDVEDYLRAKGYFHSKYRSTFNTDQDVDLKLMSDENSRNVAERFDALAEDYPWIVGEMGGVACSDELDDGTWAYTQHSRVIFNSALYGGQSESLETDFLRSCDNAFHPPGLTHQSIVDHEMTHAMESWIEENSSFKYEDKYKDFFHPSDYIMDKVAKRFGLGNAYDECQEIRAQVSVYAAKNSGVHTMDGHVIIDFEYGGNTEFLAEALSEARCSEHPREISLIVQEEFNKLIDDLGLSRKRGDGRDDSEDSFDVATYFEEHYGIRFDDEEGRWITTENNHKIHLNEEGEPDKGNPRVIEAMNGEEPKSKSPKMTREQRSSTIKKLREDTNNLRDELRNTYYRLTDAEVDVDVAEQELKDAREYLDWVEKQNGKEEEIQKAKELIEERNKALEDANKKLETRRSERESAKKALDESIEKQQKTVKEMYPTINDCEEVGDVEDYLSVVGDMSSVELSGMPIGRARRVASEVEKMIGDYPESQSIRSIKMSDLGYELYALAGSKEITFNTKYWTEDGFENVRTSYDSDVHDGFHPDGTDYGSIVNHEMAHLLEKQLSSLMHQPHPANEVMKRVIKRLEGKYSKDLEQSYRKQISGYAAKNDGVFVDYDGTVKEKTSYGRNTEWLAEAMAEARNSKNPRPLCKVVEEEFNALMDKYGMRSAKR